MLFTFFNREFIAKTSVTVHFKFAVTNTKLLASQLKISQNLWQEMTTSSNVTSSPFVIFSFPFSSFSKLIHFPFREKINGKELVATETFTHFAKYLFLNKNRNITLLNNYVRNAKNVNVFIRDESKRFQFSGKNPQDFLRSRRAALSAARRFRENFPNCSNGVQGLIQLFDRL